MKNRFQEGDLIFDFPDELSVQKLDQQGIPNPIGMAFVDFVVEEESRIFLIEVKDPSNPKAEDKDSSEFIKKLREKTLINETFVPKARDSFTYLHLMKRDNKEIILVVLLGLEQFAFDPALLVNLKDKLKKRLKQETDQPWKKEYVKDCLVVTLMNWNDFFSSFHISRASSQS